MMEKLNLAEIREKIDKIDAEIEHHHPVDLLEVRFLVDGQADVAERIGHEDEESAADQLGTFV